MTTICPTLYRTVGDILVLALTTPTPETTPPPPPVPQNLVLNPGFETPDPLNSLRPQYWTPSGSGTFIYESNCTHGGTGTRCVSVANTGTTTGAWASSEFNIDSTKTYNLSVYIKTAITSGSAKVQIAWKNANGSSFQTIFTVNTYIPTENIYTTSTPISVPLIPVITGIPATSAHINVFEAANTSGISYFDDISLTPVIIPLSYSITFYKKIDLNQTILQNVTNVRDSTTELYIYQFQASDIGNQISFPVYSIDTLGNTFTDPGCTINAVSCIPITPNLTIT